MKTIFLAPREVVDQIEGRSRHHAVLTDSGLWLVVAEIYDVELRAAVLAAPGVLELPHPNGGPVPLETASTLAVAAAAVAMAQPVDPEGKAPPAPDIQDGDRTQDVVDRAVGKYGMPVLREMLER